MEYLSLLTEYNDSNKMVMLAIYGDVCEMRALFLDGDKSNYTKILTCLKSRGAEPELRYYNTIFSLVTAVCDIYRGDVDLIFIRIHTAQDEAINMGKELQDSFPHIRLIFLSETMDCMQNIFETRPSFFLCIPLQEDYVIKAWKRVASDVEEDLHQTILIHTKGNSYRLRYSSILYIESQGRKILLYTGETCYETYIKISEIVKMLPPTFVRCHRSYIVNMNRVSQCELGEFVFLSGERIPISKSYFREVYDKYCKI